MRLLHAVAGLLLLGCESAARPAETAAPCPEVGDLVVVETRARALAVQRSPRSLTRPGGARAPAVSTRRSSAAIQSSDACNTPGGPLWLLEHRVHVRGA